MMPSARHAQRRAVAGPLRGFNGPARATLALALLAASPARAEAPSFEPPITGFVIGVELGVLAASLADARDTRTFAWAMGAGGLVGIGAGAWASGLRAEPTAPLVLRATAVGLAIPAAVLLWSRLDEPPSASASEDASPLVRAPRARTLPQKAQ